MKELISVVVPVYNVQEHIENCLNSLISQTYTNLQIILVDDGSTDESGKICDRYKELDNRVEVIHKPNGGLADARNTGLKQVKGDYIAFLDSDDYIYKTMYEDLYNLLKEYDADISEGDFLRIDVSKKLESGKIIEEENSKRNIEASCYSNLDALRLLYGANNYEYVKKVVVWNKLYKKEVIGEIEFPVGRLHEDEFTTHKILFNANKVVSTNKILHGYMQTANSIMRKPLKPKRIVDTLDSYTAASEFFKEKKLVEIEAKTRRRYLEYCIELTAKVLNSDQNQELLEKLKDSYKTFYSEYKDIIINTEKTSKESKIVEFLTKINNTLEQGGQITIEDCNELKELNK